MRHLMISVVIPTFNRAPFLKEALQSVVEQTLQPSEIIVVDDGSTDETADLCKKSFPQVRYLYQENRGVAAARNAGIKTATEKWIAFLDSDDLWLPEKLARQWEFVQENPQAKIVQTEEIWIRNGVRVNPGKRHQKKSGQIFENCVSICLVSPSAVMIDREVFEKVGAFDENFIFCEDYELWLRIALHYPIDLLPDTVTVKRNGHEGQRSIYWGQDHWRVQGLLKILNDPKLSLEQRSLVLSEMKRRLKVLAKGFTKHGRHKEAKEYQNLIIGLK